MMEEVKEIDSEPQPLSIGNDERKVTLIVYTSPAELRAIAEAMTHYKEVSVNWYHTKYIFKRDKLTPETL